MNNSYDYLFSVYLKIKDEIPTEKFSCRVVSPTWGEILLEKSKDTSSPYGRSQAIKWKDVPEKFRKSFKVVKENCNNPHKVTPDQLLKKWEKSTSSSRTTVKMQLTEAGTYGMILKMQQNRREK